MQIINSNNYSINYHVSSYKYIMKTSYFIINIAISVVQLTCLNITLLIYYKIILLHKSKL